MSIIDELYRLMGKFPEEHNVTVIDPLGVDEIRITAQEREGCEDVNGSWVQMAQEFGFEDTDWDASW